MAAALARMDRNGGGLLGHRPGVARHVLGCRLDGGLSLVACPGARLAAGLFAVVFAAAGAADWLVRPSSRHRPPTVLVLIVLWLATGVATAGGFGLVMSLVQLVFAGTVDNGARFAVMVVAACGRLCLALRRCRSDAECAGGARDAATRTSRGCRPRCIRRPHLRRAGYASSPFSVPWPSCRTSP